ncbi:hypothetical protein OAC86_00170 [bacterium]|nr:hypothetical protein [bacterium]MDB9899939.1 hypothetical protein [bacterium]
MKYIRPLNEAAATKSDYNKKIGELKDKIKESRNKEKELTRSVRDEEDPVKNELLLLTIQKEELKQEMMKVDAKINKIKRGLL